MLLFELVQNIQLLLLVTRGLASLLLPLVEHHLLDHAASLAVQVAELTVLGLDLRSVDFGGRGDDMGPPLELVHFVEVNGDFLARGCRGESPGAVVDEDGMGEGALGGVVSDDYVIHREETYIDEWLLALDSRLEGIATDLDVQVLALVLCVDGDGDVEVLDRLIPLVRQLGLLGLLPLAGLGVSLRLLVGWR